MHATSNAFSPGFRSLNLISKESSHNVDNYAVGGGLGVVTAESETQGRNGECDSRENLLLGFADSRQTNGLRCTTILAKIDARNRIDAQ